MQETSRFASLPPRVLTLVLALSVAQAEGVERRRTTGQGEEWAAAADQMFGSWFGESPAELEAIEKVEINPREERQFGDASCDAYLESLKRQRVRIVTRGKDVEYLEKLVEQIRSQLEHAERYRRIRVYWADTNETDARAFPGGSIVVMRGLVEFAESEAALVGILGHELSHIDHGHQLRQLRAMKLAQGGWAANGANDRAATYGMPANVALMTKQFARPFRAEDEATADRDAAKWMLALGYDPLELADMFRRMDRRSPRDNVRMPSFLRTHPYHAERYAAIKTFAAEARKERPDAKLYVGAENLRRRVPWSEREFVE
jgi:predicted Zn-dependent protease